MKAIIRIVIVIIALYQSTCFGEREYKGLVRAQIMEQQGNIFQLEKKFETTINSDIVCRNSTDMWDRNYNEYIFILKITNVINEIFLANLQLLTKPVGKNLVPESVYNIEVSGKLYTENTYDIENETLPKLAIEIQIDRIFTPEEIKGRFKDKLK